MYVRVLPSRPGITIQIVPKMWIRRYVASMVGAAMVTSAGMVFGKFVVLCAVVGALISWAALVTSVSVAWDKRVVLWDAVEDALISWEPFTWTVTWCRVWSFVTEVWVWEMKVVVKMVVFWYLRVVSFPSFSNPRWSIAAPDVVNSESPAAAVISRTEIAETTCSIPRREL